MPDSAKKQSASPVECDKNVLEGIRSSIDSQTGAILNLAAASEKLGASIVYDRNGIKEHGDKVESYVKHTAQSTERLSIAVEQSIASYGDNISKMCTVITEQNLSICANVEKLGSDIRVLTVEIKNDRENREKLETKVDANEKHSNKRLEDFGKSVDKKFDDLKDRIFNNAIGVNTSTVKMGFVVAIASVVGSAVVGVIFKMVFHS